MDGSAVLAKKGGGLIELEGEGDELRLEVDVGEAVRGLGRVLPDWEGLRDFFFFEWRSTPRSSWRWAGVGVGVGVGVWCLVL